MAPQNKAAYLTSQGAPLEILPAPYPSHAPDEIILRSRAVGVNIFDSLLQAYAFIPTTYPAVLGSDVAGEVVEVGSNVSDLKPGDRVMGMAHSFRPSKEGPGDGSSLLLNRPEGGAFQEYVAVSAANACKLAENVAFEDAATLPMHVLTAAAGLFPSEFLGLAWPKVHPQGDGKTVLVWGGASGVGNAAVQLGVAAGYEVFTTASVSNHERCRRNGASKVFDYKDPECVDRISEALRGKDFAGALEGSGSADAIEKCMAVVTRCDGRKIVAGAQFAPPAEKIPAGVEYRFIIVQSIRYKEQDLGRHLFREFLPEALKEGSFKGLEPVSVGHGIEMAQKALDRLKEGVSATKIIFTV